MSRFALQSGVWELHALHHMSWNQVSNMVLELNGFGIICQNLNRIKCHCNHISGNKHLESNVLESKSLESNETHPHLCIDRVDKECSSIFRVRVTRSKIFNLLGTYRVCNNLAMGVCTYSLDN